MANLKIILLKNKRFLAEGYYYTFHRREIGEDTSKEVPVNAKNIKQVEEAVLGLIDRIEELKAENAKLEAFKEGVIASNHCFKEQTNGE